MALLGEYLLFSVFSISKSHLHGRGLNLWALLFVVDSSGLVRKICVNSMDLRNFLRLEFFLILSMKKARKIPSLL
jgi:hypothetical protein